LPVKVKILFISISWPASGCRNLYADLMDEFRARGEEVYVLATGQGGRMFGARGEAGNIKKVEPAIENGIRVLRVFVGPIRKVSPVRKGLALLGLGARMFAALRREWPREAFDLVIAPTPPVTLSGLFRKVKRRYGAPFYLLLKDIWPQGSVDLGVLHRYGLPWLWLRAHELRTYRVADYVGCMSPRGVAYFRAANPGFPASRVEECPNSIRPSLAGETSPNNMRPSQTGEEYPQIKSLQAEEATLSFNPLAVEMDTHAAQPSRVEVNVQSSRVEVNAQPSRVEVNAQPLIMPVATEALEIRRRYAIPEGACLFVFSGNLGIGHGLPFLTEVIKQLEEYREAFFLVGGSGTCLARVRADLSGIQRRNALVYSWLPEEDFHRLMEASDVGLILLHRYTVPQFPSRLLTYFDHAKAVLCAVNHHTDIGEIVERHGCGLSVPHGDVSRFTEAVRFLATHREVRREMGQNGWRLLLEKYTVARSYDIIMHHFKN
jgi:glycosyltransferase involved in cell wall biosynthesis